MRQCKQVYLACRRSALIDGHSHLRQLFSKGIGSVATVQHGAAVQHANVLLEIHWRHASVAECIMYQTQQVQQQDQLVSIRINSVCISGRRNPTRNIYFSLTATRRRASLHLAASQ